MKKPLAILLAFFIVFAPVYSNAVLPALAATVASNSGRVLVGNMIKKVAPQALNNARKTMVGICKANPAKCSALGIGVGGLTSAIVGDGWNIDVTNNDVTNDIDVDIYKQAKMGQCEFQFSYSNPNSPNQRFPFATLYSSSLAALNNPDNPNSNPSVYSYVASKDWLLASSNFELSIKSSVSSAEPFDWRSSVDFIKPDYDVYFKSNNSFDTSRAFVFNGYYRCVMPPSSKIYITNNELNQYITNNNINDIDILDIYNFDFSQYNNITIGGDTYNGTTINNDLAKSDPSETDKKVSADLKKKLDAKELSLDDVNDENCTKNEAGEYDKCGATEEPPVDEEPEEPVESPIECDANGFYKKVCDWMDWTQTKHDKPESGNIDIVDKSDGLDINDDRITFDDQCPPPTPIELVVMGFPYSEELDYQPFCDFFGMLNPFVVGMGGISSALIIAGGIRRG